MSIRDRILSVLEEGDSPARDVADELGLEYRSVNAYLCELYRRKCVARRVFYRPQARAVWLYSVLD